jgi:ribosomal protein S18 acetylase RimI-like enzyme
MTTRLQRVSEFAQYAPAGSRQQGGYLTTVQLSWVAVMRECQRRGFGTVMMGAALRDFYEIVIRAGVCAMTLQAIDQSTSEFYRRLGFLPYGQTDAMMPKMFLAADAVIEMIESNAVAPLVTV